MLKCVLMFEKNEKQIWKRNKTNLQREYLVLKVCLVFSYFHFCYHLQNVLQTLRSLAFLNQHSAIKFLSSIFFRQSPHTNQCYRATLHILKSIQLHGDRNWLNLYQLCGHLPVVLMEP